MGAQAKRGKPNMPLAARLEERIAQDATLSVHDYMQACLASTRDGYYARRQPIGRTGDFITAPEISQIFGELIGLWAAAVWQSMGSPPNLVLAELGPGRGTLMADALRALKSVPKLLAGTSVALVETSKVLRDVQRQTLGSPRARLQWFETVADVPQGPLIVLANEFIDSLPIRQLVRQGCAWHERAVTISPSGELVFCAGAKLANDALPPVLREMDAAQGDIFEIRPGADELLDALAERAKVAPVAALIADYGHERSGIGDTLQAVSRHRFADPLAHPGEADLSAHVDFAALAESARGLGLDVYGPMPQGEFLLRIGLAARCERLLRNAAPEERADIVSGAARLAGPQQMGLLFKVLVLQSLGLAPPPPFGDSASSR